MMDRSNGMTWQVCETISLNKPFDLDMKLNYYISKRRK